VAEFKRKYKFVRPRAVCFQVPLTEKETVDTTVKIWSVTQSSDLHLNMVKVASRKIFKIHLKYLFIRKWV